jgi:hypothetical protein
MPSPQDAGELGALPQFAPGSPDDPPLTHPEAETTPPPPSTSSSPPTPPRQPPDRPATSPKTSSTTSSEDLDEGLANVAGGGLVIGGALLNKWHQKRNRTTGSRVWLPTDDEVQTFGEAAGRIAARRVPDEIKEGDGADIITMGGVLMAYAARNALGISDQDMAHAADPDAPAPAVAPEPGQPYSPAPYVEPPTAPPPREAPPASVSVAGGTPVTGVEAATPAPPPYIPTDI